MLYTGIILPGENLWQNDSLGITEIHMCENYTFFFPVIILLVWRTSFLHTTMRGTPCTTYMVMQTAS